MHISMLHVYSMFKMFFKIAVSYLLYIIKYIYSMCVHMLVNTKNEV
jgi:hypothetical protein